MFASVFILTYYVVRLSVRGLAYMGALGWDRLCSTPLRGMVLGPARPVKVKTAGPVARWPSRFAK